MTLKLEVNKAYRNREGSKVNIVGMRVHRHYRYMAEDGGSYTEDGRFRLDETPHGFDLVGEWGPEAEVDRDAEKAEREAGARRGMKALVIGMDRGGEPRDNTAVVLRIGSETHILLQPFAGAFIELAESVRQHEAAGADDVLLDRIQTALDNVTDYDTSTGEYAKAALDAIRPYLRAEQPAAQPVADAPQPVQKTCDLCDCTGDVHRPDGEWLGSCPYCSPERESVAQPDKAEVVERLKASIRENSGGHRLENGRGDVLWHAKHPVNLTLLAEALSAPPPADTGPGWQPIETAPRDGFHMLLYRPEICFVGYYAVGGDWIISASGLPPMYPLPTHWMPLPKRPAAEPCDHRSGGPLIRMPELVTGRPGLLECGDCGKEVESQPVSERE